MKRSEKGVLGIILAATLMIGATAVVSANGGTLVDPNSFASKGKIQVKENETDPDPAIVIDSADLVTLANATNELNTQFTDSLAAAVNNIGSVPKTDRVAAGAQFSDLLSAITNSQAIDTSESVYVLPNGTVTDDSTAEGVVETQIAGATAENLTAGTAAWVDGQYIVGTGADNNSYYAKGYTSACVSSSNIISSGKHESRGDLYQSAQIIGSVVIPEDITSVIAIAVGTGTVNTSHYYTSVMAEMSFSGYDNIEDTICNDQITAEHLDGQVRAKTHILIQKFTVTPGSTLNISAQIYYEDACYWAIVKN